MQARNRRWRTLVRRSPMLTGTQRSMCALQISEGVSLPSRTRRSTAGGSPGFQVRCQFSAGETRCQRCIAGSHECVARFRKKRKAAQCVLFTFGNFSAGSTILTSDFIDFPVFLMPSGPTKIYKLVPANRTAKSSPSSRSSTSCSLTPRPGDGSSRRRNCCYWTRAHPVVRIPTRRLCCVAHVRCVGAPAVPNIVSCHYYKSLIGPLDLDLSRMTM